jgi:hypothetical protein
MPLEAPPFPHHFWLADRPVAFSTPAIRKKLENEKTNTQCGIQPPLTLNEISVTRASFLLVL